jgi:phosphoribosylamine--glycine ligase
MRILIVGSGAREDALSWALTRSASTTAVFASPGNAGTASRGTNWNTSASDGKALAERCKSEKIDLVVVGPETAIAAGVCDKLREAGIAVFGPGRAVGRLETSKIFAKRFMEKYNVPTASFRAVHSIELARRALEDWRGGVVVKADGLAAGKGVVVTDTPAEALAVLENWYGSGKVPGGGTAVVLEERLSGPELSLFAIGDGQVFVPFASACDYKRAGDGNTGPNTGGMGAYSPPFGFPENFTERVMEEVLNPVLAGLREEREQYRGVLYCGLMWTDQGPKVIEFNVRFGDPETQVLMPRVEGDLAALLMSAAKGKIDNSLARVAAKAAVGVVLATSEYPVRSSPIAGLPVDVELGDAQAFWGTSERIETADGPRVNAGGGRVLTVTATGVSLGDAREKAYEAVRTLAARFGRRELSYRTDIGAMGVTV